MATNPHARAVALALATNDALGALFDDLGSKDDERGIYGIYALFLALLEQLFDVPVQALGALGRMELQLERELNTSMGNAASLGISTALSLLSLRGFEAVAGAELLGAPLRAAAVDALMGIVRAQIGTARSAILYNVFDRETVLGSAERPGLLAPGPVVRESARWIAATSSAAQVQVIDAGLGDARDEWGLQAVAAIDERTTECCLKVHGQVAPLGEPFRLTGEPRYADEMSAPPFHQYCRSSLALVKLDEATDALSRDMVDAAYAEFVSRKTGDKRAVRVPSSAVSRRS